MTTPPLLDDAELRRQLDEIRRVQGPTTERLTVVSDRVSALDRDFMTHVAIAPVPPPLPPPPPAPATALFTISGNKILDPTGAKFVVRGMTPIYGAFAGGDSDGAWAKDGLQRSAAIMADMRNNWRANTVRIFTSGGAVLGHAGADWDQPNYKSELWNVVANARAQNLVVLLVNSYSNGMDSAAWLKELAARYKDDPYVWLTPSNEPLATSPDATEKSHQYDWAYWKGFTEAQIKLIRDEGFKNPIVINSPSWSWGWQGMPPVYDPQNALILGAHRYSNGKMWSTTEAGIIDAAWANLSATRAVIMDEIGNYNEGVSNANWYQGMTQFLAQWVLTRNGAGAIGFCHYWSDGNAMMASPTTRSTWGNYWRANFLAKVP